MPKATLTYNSSPDFTFTGFTSADRGDWLFTEELVNIPATLPSSNSGNGHNWDEGIGSGSYNKWHASLDEAGAFSSTVLESIDTSVGEIDTDGSIKGISTGDCRIRCSYPGKESKIYTKSMSSLAVSTYVELTSLASGSLVKHCHDAIQTLISSQTAGPITQQYLSANNLDPDSPSVTLNSNHFAYGGVDFSSISVMTEKTGVAAEVRHCALVSAIHATCAYHYSPDVGDRVVFRRSNGTYQVSTVDTKTKISSTDVCVLTFTSEVTGLTPLDVITQAQIEQYAPRVTDLGYSHALYGLRRTHHYADGVSGSGLLPQRLVVGSFGAGNVATNYGGGRGIDEWQTVYYGDSGSWMMSAPLGGDSSGPIVLLINNNPVLLAHTYSIWYSPLVAGTDIVSAVNSEMANAGSYSLSNPTLSTFNDYS